MVTVSTFQILFKHVSIHFHWCERNFYRWNIRINELDQSLAWSKTRLYKSTQKLKENRSWFPNLLMQVPFIHIQKYLCHRRDPLSFELTTLSSSCSCIIRSQTLIHLSRVYLSSSKSSAETTSVSWLSNERKIVQTPWRYVPASKQTSIQTFNRPTLLNRRFINE